MVEAPGVEVLAHGGLHEHRILGNEANGMAQDLQAKGLRVDTVEEDAAVTRLQNAEQAQQERRLAAARGANNACFGTRLDGDADVLEDVPGDFTVACAQVLDDDFAAVCEPTALHLNSELLLLAVAKDVGDVLRASAGAVGCNDAVPRSRCLQEALVSQSREGPILHSLEALGTLHLQEHQLLLSIRVDAVDLPPAILLAQQQLAHQQARDQHAKAHVLAVARHLVGPLLLQPRVLVEAVE
mmetsp:Transcript_41547/g.96282  ORF Transcript_41547/g.96282 Transcript_41547/m.96282 type:complete len:241 (-) Transcript_41547:1596-2318(-)